ncbi:MAG TPA: hypothetical protein PK816_04735, partial [Candidatus Cloacimonadota bacterium]|nr:hypothetical protein [Candidatus Cloacimonadota bacterium]
MKTLATKQPSNNTFYLKIDQNNSLNKSIGLNSFSGIFLNNISQKNLQSASYSIKNQTIELSITELKDFLMQSKADVYLMKNDHLIKVTEHFLNGSNSEKLNNHGNANNVQKMIKPQLEESPSYDKSGVFIGQSNKINLNDRVAVLNKIDNQNEISEKAGFNNSILVQLLINDMNIQNQNPDKKVSKKNVNSNDELLEKDAKKQQPNLNKTKKYEHDNQSNASNVTKKEVINYKSDLNEIMKTTHRNIIKAVSLEKNRKMYFNVKTDNTQTSKNEKSDKSDVGTKSTSLINNLNKEIQKSSQKVNLEITKMNPDKEETSNSKVENITSFKSNIQKNKVYDLNVDDSKKTEHTSNEILTSSSVRIKSDISHIKNPALKSIQFSENDVARNSETFKSNTQVITNKTPLSNHNMQSVHLQENNKNNHSEPLIKTKLQSNLQETNHYKNNKENIVDSGFKGDRQNNKESNLINSKLHDSDFNQNVRQSRSIISEQPVSKVSDSFQVQTPEKQAKPYFQVKTRTQTEHQQIPLKQEKNEPIVASAKHESISKEALINPVKNNHEASAPKVQQAFIDNRNVEPEPLAKKASVAIQV